MTKEVEGTFRSAASRFWCAELHPHDVAGGGAAGAAAVAAPAAPPPSTAVQWPRSGGSAFQTVSTQLKT